MVGVCAVLIDELVLTRLDKNHRVWFSFVRQ